jgi:hypothetical protein
MKSTWIRIGCACLGAIVLAGCQQDKDREDDADDMSTTASGRLEAGGVEERMSPSAERVAKGQFPGSNATNIDSVVSSSGETYFGVELGGDRRVIFNSEGVAVTGAIPASATAMSVTAPPPADVDVTITQ